MPTNPDINKPDKKNIQDLMTAEERKATGFSRLSAGELQALNAWLETNIGKLAKNMGGLAPGDQPQ